MQKNLASAKPDPDFGNQIFTANDSLSTVANYNTIAYQLFGLDTDTGNYYLLDPADQNPNGYLVGPADYFASDHAAAASKISDSWISLW